MVQAYITKFCLSDGIKIVQGRVDGTRLWVDEQTGPPYYDKGDWYLKWEAALARAEHCRLDSIRSAKRRMKKLEDIVFTKPELV